MEHFLITYHMTDGSPDEWHAAIGRFIAAVESDPALAGKIAYRAMRTANGDYYHLATVTDDGIVKTLAERAFFERYTAQTEQVAGGRVEVTPVELIAQTFFRA